MHKVVQDPGVVATLPSSNKHWYDSLMRIVPDIASGLGALAGSRLGPTGMQVGSVVGNALGTAAEHYVSPANFEQPTASHGGGVPYTGNVTMKNSPMLALTY